MDITYDNLITLLYAKADLNKIPLGGSFELTPRCTLNCKMCYIHRRENDKSVLSLEKNTSFWIDLAKKARDSGMLMLLLTGGEPLLRQDFDEIYVACKKLGLLVSINTNATLIDEAKIELFKQYPPHKVNITLYGASPETYGELCGNAAAFEKVTHAIRKMVEAGIKVKLNYSITPSNVADIPAVTDFAKKLNLPVQSASYMFAPVRGGAEEFRLTAEEAARAKFEWQRCYLGDEKLLETLEADFPSPEGDVMCSEPINCRAGSSTFWVTWQGKMCLCGMMGVPNFEIDDFKLTWQRICDERKKFFLPAECSVCCHRKKCDVCAAVAVAENGKSNCVPAYACQKAHEYAKLCKEFSSRQ